MQCSDCSDGKKEVIQMSYLKMTSVEKDQLISSMQKAVATLSKQEIRKVKNSQEFAQKLFDNDDVCDMLIYLSRLPVFSKEFAEALKHNLDLLSIAKKLKYFTNLSLGQNAMLLNSLAEHLSSPIDGMQGQVDGLFKDRGFADLRVKDYMKEQAFDSAKKYLDNDVALEKIDPHSVYPTSIYRHCDGCTMATPDSQTIESVMSTSVTTTIKITRGILNPSNKILAEVYKPLGRCIAIIDDKVEKHYGQDLQDYFTANGISLIKLVHAGNELNKDMQNVEAILVDMKNHGVARNEAVLIVGGGVIADLGGFATALYHRNTPYVMLCTSIVTGIDAGPSPRTCCDGYGFKNLYGAYHPPILTITDRSFWKSLHEGWIRHGIAEIIKMACVEDLPLFELVERAGIRLIRTKFGTEGCDDDQEFQDLCDNIVGKAMESYVRSEYGNLWETHQCRPHAFGHTWSPGYELPAGMLHGHAVATCMGYGAYLSYKRNWLSQQHFNRILKLISDMELALWHPIMDNHDLVIAANKKAHQKRGGNLCAPVPKDEIGRCGYINDLRNEDVPPTMNEYKALVANMPRCGHGVDVHCHDVGLEDPSIVATDALVQIGQAPEAAEQKSDLPGSAAGAGLEACLGDQLADKDLLGVLSAISRSVVDIGVALRDGNKGFAAKQVGTQNSFGDNQLEVDVTSDRAVFKRLEASGLCAAASSEETTREVQLGGSKYCVAFDPLDGSSIVDANFSVGSIFGVWEGTTLINRTGREQKAAAMAMYGPRITMAVAVSSQKVVELTFQGGAWAVTKEQMHIAPEGQVFAPGNLRASADNEKYSSLVQCWLQEKYTLRYTGGLVPDVYHILCKQMGVFTNCSSPMAKAKLRLLYESAPVAFIVEAAGGKSMVDPASSGGEKMSVLDLVVDDLEKCVGFCCGGVAEVDKFEKFMF